MGRLFSILRSEVILCTDLASDWPPSGSPEVALAVMAAAEAVSAAASEFFEIAPPPAGSAAPLCDCATHDIDELEAAAAALPPLGQATEADEPLTRTFPGVSASLLLLSFALTM